MRVILGDYEFYPNPTSLSMKPSKIIGRVDLLGKSRDSIVGLKQDAKNISLSAIIIDRDEDSYTQGALYKGLTIEDQRAHLVGLLDSGRIHPFQSDLTGSTYVVISTIAFKEVAGEPQFLYMDMDLIEYVSEEVMQ